MTINRHHSLENEGTKLSPMRFLTKLLFCFSLSIRFTLASKRQKNTKSGNRIKGNNLCMHGCSEKAPRFFALCFQGQADGM